MSSRYEIATKPLRDILENEKSNLVNAMVYPMWMYPQIDIKRKLKSKTALVSTCLCCRKLDSGDRDCMRVLRNFSQDGIAPKSFW